MTSWTEILKANKGLHARDSFSELWGLKLKAARAEFPDYTITGTLPLTFNSRAAVALKNYRIYGTANGAGVATESGEPAGFKIPILNTSGVTENEFDYTIPYASYLQSDGTVKSTVYNISVTIVSLAQWIGKEITISIRCDSTESTRTYIRADIGGVIRESNYIYSGGSGVMTLTITPANENDAFVVSYGSYSQAIVVLSDFMIVKGSTPPDHYIPHRYESNHDLFIGDTKLGEEEYLDYAEQKIYKDVSGTLTPTDPPAPLPAIQAYQGENTLSSTETVGEVSVKGRISEVQNG